MIKNKPILLDTCVINNLLSKEKLLAEKTERLLVDLLKNNNDLYFSQLTNYELLRGAPDEKKKKAERLLGYFIEVPFSKERLERATRLYTAYVQNKATKSIFSSISDIDIFIGALIFTKQKPLLLTADFNDFPRPFFREKSLGTIEYERKRGNKCCQYYYFLEANLKELFGK